MKSVFCLASNDEQANRIVDQLLNANFANEDISVLYPDQKARTRGTQTVSSNEFREERSDRYREISNEPVKSRAAKKNSLSTDNTTKAPEGAVTGAVAGGLLGGSLGLLAGIGALAIPGLGPFIAAGPLMAALGGSGVGGSLGLLIGGLVGMGIPEYEAKRYETGLKAGKVLICVQVNTGEEVTQVEKIMKKEGATDISSSREKARSY